MSSLITIARLTATHPGDGHRVVVHAMRCEHLPHGDFAFGGYNEIVDTIEVDVDTSAEFEDAINTSFFSLVYTLGLKTP